VGKKKKTTFLFKTMTDIDIHRVTLKFFDFNFSPEELTSKLDLEPTETAIKGQEFFVGPKHKQIRKIWPWNFWAYQVEIVKRRHWIGDQIDDFIDNIIKPKQEKIKTITATCKAEFSIVQYIYEGCNPGLQFNKERLKVIADIGAEIDADIYVLGNEKEINKK
jgi:hypothetical protein